MHHVFTPFSKNLDFSISLTGKIPVSNKKPQGDTPPKFRCLTRVWGIKPAFLARVSKKGSAERDWAKATAYYNAQATFAAI